MTVNPGARSQPRQHDIVLRRGNTKKYLVRFWDDDERTVASDVSAWDFEGCIHTLGDPSDVLASYVITRPAAGQILYTLTTALIESLPEDSFSFGHYKRFRTAADSDVLTFHVGTAFLEEV